MSQTKDICHCVPRPQRPSKAFWIWVGRRPAKTKREKGKIQRKHDEILTNTVKRFDKDPTFELRHCEGRGVFVDFRVTEHYHLFSLHVEYLILLWPPKPTSSICAERKSVFVYIAVCRRLTIRCVLHIWKTVQHSTQSLLFSPPGSLSWRQQLNTISFPSCTERSTIATAQIVLH